MERQIETGGQGAHKFQIRVRFCTAQTVVEMGDLEDEAQFPARFAILLSKRAQQGDRVRSTRHGDGKSQAGTQRRGVDGERNGHDWMINGSWLSVASSGPPILGSMLTTRDAVAADAALIAEHRFAMFAEMGKSERTALDEMKRNFVAWVVRMIGAGKYVGWIVMDEEGPVASGGFFELDWPPHPLDPAAEHRGYLLNFWVDPEHRGEGLARMLVRKGLAESQRRGLRVTALHASEAGRRVYEKMGFSDTSELICVEQTHA